MSWLIINSSNDRFVIFIFIKLLKFTCNSNKTVFQIGFDFIYLLKIFQNKQQKNSFYWKIPIWAIFSFLNLNFFSTIAVEIAHQNQNLNIQNPAKQFWRFSFPIDNLLLNYLRRFFPFIIKKKNFFLCLLFCYSKQKWLPKYPRYYWIDECQLKFVRRLIMHQYLGSLFIFNCK